MAKREVEQWITINGVHVPVFKGESKADAAKNFKARAGKRNANQPITQKGKANAKKEYTNARNAAHNASEDKKEKADARFDKAKQKYTEAKEKKVIKSAKAEKKGSEVSEEKLRSYGYDPHDSTGDPTVIQSDKGDFYKIGDNKWNEHSKSGKALGGTYTDKQIADKLKDAKQVKVLPSENKKQDAQINKDFDDKEKQLARNKAEASRSQQSERVENYKALIEKFQKQGMSLEEAKEKAYRTGDIEPVSKKQAESRSSRTENQIREDQLKSQIKHLEKNAAFNKDARSALGEFRARVDEHRRFESGKEDMGARLKQLQAQEKSLTKTDAFNPEARQTLKELRGRIDEIQKMERNDAHESTGSKGLDKYLKENNLTMNDIYDKVKSDPEMKKTANELMQQGMRFDYAAAVAYKYGSDEKAPVTRYEKARQEAQKSSVEEPQTTRWKKAYDQAQTEAKHTSSKKGVLSQIEKQADNLRSSNMDYKLVSKSELVGRLLKQYRKDNNLTQTQWKKLYDEYFKKYH